jgi:hypothetical protein
MGKEKACLVIHHGGVTCLYTSTFLERRSQRWSD